jgi:hypothetical protein
MCGCDIGISYGIGGLCSQCHMTKTLKEQHIENEYNNQNRHIEDKYARELAAIDAAYNQQFNQQFNQPTGYYPTYSAPIEYTPVQPSVQPEPVTVTNGVAGQYFDVFLILAGLAFSLWLVISLDFSLKMALLASGILYVLPFVRRGLF